MIGFGTVGDLSRLFSLVIPAKAGTQ